MASPHMSLTRRPRLALVLALLLTSAANGVLQGTPQSPAFDGLPSEFAQHVFGVATDLNFNLGGLVALQNGDLVVAECAERGAKLHHFDASTTEVVQGTPVHPQTEIGTGGGCGLAIHPNGFIYSNTKETSGGGTGVAEIEITTRPDGEVQAKVKRRFGRMGNGLGIAVDPLTSHLLYADAGCKPPVPAGFATCNLVEVASDGTEVRLIPMPSVVYAGGVAFDPSGRFLFVTDRLPIGEQKLVVIDSASGTVVQSVPLPNDPVGLGFRLEAPRFIVTNNQDGTITRLDFPGDDYTVAPVVSDFAVNGFRGDFVQAGPDTCLYVTQHGVKYNNGEFETSTTESIVRICEGFAPPPGIEPNSAPLLSSICGAVYYDGNDDGIRGGDEPGIAAVTVTLTGSDELGRTVSRSTATVDHGGYCFQQLRAGTYTVRETQPAGYRDGKDTQGTPGSGTAGNDEFLDVVLAPGIDGLNNNFGERPLDTDLRLISVTAPAKVTSGSSFVYSIRVENAGPSPADDVVMSTPIPASTTFVAFVAPAGWSCTAPAVGGGGAVTCRKTSMAIAETATLQVTALSACDPTVTAVTMTGTVTSSTPEGDPANNSASATTALAYPALTIANAVARPPSSWPPNHKMADVGVTYTVSGGCGGARPQTRLTCSGDDGADASDWEVVTPNLVRVRSERSGGNKSGRTYSITITATDNGGVRADKTVTVLVPHDQRKKK